MLAEGSGATREAVVMAVRAAVGTRFRPQGRLQGLGLDCVGVALLAARAAGLKADRLPAYALNGDHGELLDAVLAGLGCRAVSTALAGDLLVAAPSPRHRHLAVVVPGGIVHAHAGLGKVVESPLDGSWTIIGTWRFPGVQ